LKLTLTQMAFGGIYDQIGGGFARYSTDNHWFAPHFEKMLYDNGQLVSLYSEAYNITKDGLYKKIVHDTIKFVEREMTDPDGGFYSAFDADSEGEEGKYYVWKFRELEEILMEDAPLMIKYYNAGPHGNWENGNNILHKKKSDEEFALANDIDLTELQRLVEKSNKLLFETREKRPRPGLDDKILTGWNGLMLKGICDAYAVFGEQKYLQMALKNANFIESKMFINNKLKRNYKNGKATIDAYLEDYAFVIEAYIALYQVTFDEKWIQRADDMTGYTLENFYDETETLFFYTDKNSEKLIARKKEIFDNVIPSSNSAMALNLNFLGIILDREVYKEISKKMVDKVGKLIKLEPSYLSNWACQYANFIVPTAEVAIVGKEADKFRSLFETYYFPNKVIMGTEDSSNLPLLEGKKGINNKTTIYVCYNKTCKLPVNNVAKAVSQLIH
ncbi:MAG: thioredoxin domain-containing protein, partial [Bacteroidota bacterium]|nr:thioredoxin domain-containing protein [Bacteroidota bacterium]